MNKLLSLDQIEVKQINGVSAQKQSELHAFGVFTVKDLLEYYPFRYEDYRPKSLSEVKHGEKATLIAKVIGIPVLQRYGGKSRISCKMVAEPWMFTATWFNQPYVREQLTAGREIVLSGKWDQKRSQITVSNYEFPDRGEGKTGTLQPVYSVGGKITQTWLRKVINQGMQQYGELIPEILPQVILRKYDFMPRKKAIATIHQPEDTREGQQGRRRMVYEELFLFQLKVQAFRVLNQGRMDGVRHTVDNATVRQFVRSLPFELTDAQKHVELEILQDMRSASCMNRLLQGDVGSGKTVLAAIALYASVKSGFQGALMVPTEILAEQHMRSLTRMFEPFGITVGLLTGSVSGRKRKDLLASLQMGMLDIVVGTHALIQEDVFFRELGLVVTDEQHRFGVNQRSILRRKGYNPDVLTMTATPIPRTLAITVFGDMDVSTLSERPKGRVPITTYWVKHDLMERVLKLVNREVDQGRQAYLICPLIEESEKLDVQNAIDLHVQMSQAFPDYRVGLLHGRMTPAEKDEVMRAFYSNEIQLLVSTTVVEVGVDVPNATLMIIMDADRFGLSQLHQLRGRVGRGQHASYCVLVADPKSEIGRERMTAMTDTDDGFEVSRRDLELRGPGDFFGTKQSGLPEFRLADMTADFEVLEQARDDAAMLLKDTTFWTSADYAPLRSYLQAEQIFQGEIID
ncbi:MULTISPECIES: ATP-dependent DNA helicase RecG [unclassified Paenibacillus]|uniref:ATP-dependent DNA helicase RecG n=1 Tax=unclassified Paenibacillus TaxID=185978 RepID=UPI0024076408|nr:MULTISPECIES: ATP-dependent DNA helicase RecG [unclassified Paenibacillus]MDF9842916.1 ATP-dependent DNA helicase RecG [Paenibacillus sp. PastF-2]MDF9849504.1 ATP-dependent DNA helicase RecG [Paenibacillus sp. PastM-2]MDF9856121.1 ATP-dependent DNA helicase RecG [Paenibacillus sp. PastF-1]MDH6481347.1 ATP-dependent DNA helicase RecG [Paenibacillus sp. PastH-2]MDH6508810.1 ATP-dependent DNA helicase RecG [Paenibacillus sp. PastM-3]